MASGLRRDEPPGCVRTVGGQAYRLAETVVAAAEATAPLLAGLLFAAARDSGGLAIFLAPAALCALAAVLSRCYLPVMRAPAPTRRHPHRRAAC